MLLTDYTRPTEVESCEHTWYNCAAQTFNAVGGLQERYIDHCKRNVYPLKLKDPRLEQINKMIG